MRRLVLTTILLLVVFLVLTTRVWYEEWDPLGFREPLSRLCIQVLGQRFVVLTGEKTPTRTGLGLYEEVGRRIVFRVGSVVVLNDPSWCWGCPMEGGVRDMVANACEIVYLVGIALWPLLTILFFWIDPCLDSEKKIVEVGIVALFTYTILGCLSWFGQLVDATRLLIWPIVLRHEEWWWAFRIIGRTEPWSVGSWEIGAAIVGAILLVACTGFMWWLLRPLHD